MLTRSGFRRAKDGVSRTGLRAFVLAAALALSTFSPSAQAQVRIKDIADVEGVRDNQLVGYGLVVGLPGTGDRLRSAVFTRQSLVGMLERLGVNTRDQETSARHAQRRRGHGHRQPARLRPPGQRGSTSRSPRSATPPT